MELNDQIRLARERKGLSFEEVAEALECSAQAVKYWEAGATTPRIPKLKALETLLGVRLSSTGTISDNTPPHMVDMSAEMVDLVRKIDSLPKNLRDAIVTTVNHLSLVGQNGTSKALSANRCQGRGRPAGGRRSD